MVFSNCITMMRRILLVVEMVHSELAMAASFGWSLVRMRGRSGEAPTPETNRVEAADHGVAPSGIESMWEAVQKHLDDGGRWLGFGFVFHKISARGTPIYIRVFLPWCAQQGHILDSSSNPDLIRCFGWHLEFTSVSYWGEVFLLLRLGLHEGDDSILGRRGLHGQKKGKEKKVVGQLWASRGARENHRLGCTGEEKEWAGVWADLGVFEDLAQAGVRYRNTLLIYKHIIKM
jgi:hypothetical protein